MGTKQVFAVASAAFVAFSLSVTANATTVKQTTNDGGGKSSLTDWDASSGSPKGTPTSGNDYVSEMTLRAPSDKSNVDFGGNSLRFGTVGGTAGTFVPYGGTYTFNRDGLILAKGQFNPYSSSRTSTLAGLVTVTSPDSAPFEFWLSYGNNKNNIYGLSAKLCGNVGTGLLICERAADSSGKFILAPAAGSDFAGTIKIGGKAASEPYSVQCELQGGPALGCTLWATPYATVTPQYAGTQWTIGTLRLDAGSTWAVKLTNDPKANTITLTDGLTTADSVNLTFTQGARQIDTEHGYVWNVLKLPKEKKGQIHPEHFVLKTQKDNVGLFPEKLPSVGLRVTEKNDLAILELVQRQVVQNVFADDKGYGYSDQNFEFPTSITNAFAWSNSKLPRADIDYIAAYDLNAAPPSQCVEGSYAFPGASLTLSNDVIFSEAAHCLTVPMLRVMYGSQLWPIADPWEDRTAEVRGRIHVITDGKSSSDAAIVRVRRNCMARICSEITGSGRIQVQPNGDDIEGSCVVFDNNNINFLGKIRITANRSAVTDFKYGETLILKAANNVGGPLTSFTKDALEIRNHGNLRVTNDVEFATQNRGVRINSAGRIEVTEGATFSVKTTLSLDGELAKTGKGVLAVSTITTNGTTGAMIVSEGKLRPLAANSLKGTPITFDGGALLVDTTVASGDLSTKGADMTGMTAPFGGFVNVAFGFADGETEHDVVGYPVCTVDASANVTAKAVRIPRHRVIFRWRDNGDDTKTLLADISQTGFAVILR